MQHESHNIENNTSYGHCNYYCSKTCINRNVFALSFASQAVLILPPLLGLDTQLLLQC